LVPRDPSVIARLAFWLSVGLVALAAPSHAAGERPGDFDFFVLSLSWSPSYCAFDEDPDQRQCRESHGFVVHGLWPQYERGYPSFCRTPISRRVPDGVANSVIDIMPSYGLIRHEWEAHGLCTGLYPNEYFALLRRAFERVRIPVEFKDAPRDRRLAPAAIEQAFAAANPGLSQRGMAVSCDRDGFAELRICMDKALRFRACVQVDRGGCRDSRILVPAMP
jgi:ribonuclease T2